MLVTQKETTFNRRKFCKSLGGLFVPSIVGLSSKALAQSIGVYGSLPFEAISTSVSSPIVSSGLFAHYFSSDFDASTNGSLINGWFSQENPSTNSQGDKWDTGGGGDQPTVDGTILCNGHKTIRFNGKCNLNCTGNPVNNNGIYHAASYPTGIEYFVVFQNDVDPPSGNALGNNGAGTPCTDNGAVITLIVPTTNNGEHTPFQDGNVYNGFGMTTRPNCGNPTTSTAGGWHCLNVSTPNPAGTRSLWLDTENFHTDSGYTFNKTCAGYTSIGITSMLGGFGNGQGGAASFWGLKGNIAAVFCYNKVLSSSERTQMRAYLKANWGVTGF